jgi:acetyltransferase
VAGATAVVDRARRAGRTILTEYEAKQVLQAYGIPTGAPALAGGEEDVDADAATALVDAARREGRTLLDEYESKRVVAAYGIPVVQTEVARTEDEALLAAAQIGYPVVLKLYSRTITHKTDVGGVKLNLNGADDVARSFLEIRTAVTAAAGAEHFQGVTVQPMVGKHGRASLRDAYELIVGSSIDPQFGPVLLFGGGGQLVEVYRDRSLALPPLNATLARRMMEQTKIYTALKGVRGRAPVDLAALDQLLVRFSRLVVEQRWVREIDINPLLAGPGGLIALDARVVLYDKDFPEADLPRPAIRPYPLQYVTPFKTTAGKDVTIRPIRPEDEPLIVKFHRTLSDRSVRLRYFATMKLDHRTTHVRLARVCFNDYDREMALVVEHAAGQGEPEIVGVGRLSKIPGLDEAEFALLVSDAWQRQGLGQKLLRMMLQIARDEKVARVTADILPENTEMQRLCEQVGFRLHRDLAQNTVRAAIAN